MSTEFLNKCPPTFKPLTFSIFLSALLKNVFSASLFHSEFTNQLISGYLWGKWIAKSCESESKYTSSIFLLCGIELHQYKEESPSPFSPFPITSAVPVTHIQRVVFGLGSLLVSA